MTTVKGWPLKNVAWMSLGAMGSAAKALLAWKNIVATTNGSARIEPRGMANLKNPVWLIYTQSRGSGRRMGRNAAY